jgi:hypothetical protein
MRWKSRKHEDFSLLEQAVDAWREDSPTERLSSQVRHRIFDEARRPTQARIPAMPLFPPVRRLALAAAVPALALALLVLYGSQSGPDGSLLAGAPRLLATKSGDEVVFVIANGSQEHQVRRLARAAQLQGEPMAVSNGTFRDRLSSDSQLVFYRID